jgi:hypothetical protein
MTTNANETKLNNKEQQAVFYPTSAQLISEDTHAYNAVAASTL